MIPPSQADITDTWPIRRARSRVMLPELARTATATNAPERDILLANLTRELQLRDHYWPLALEGLPGDRSSRSLFVIAGVLIMVATLSIHAVLIAIVAPALAGIWTLVRARFTPIVPQHALRKAFLNGNCIDCGYDLAGVPDAIDPGLLDGIDIGPAACPECGASWPRVPPRVPAAFDEPLDPAQRGARLNSSGSSTNSS
jgi:hypothetical protein